MAIVSLVEASNSSSGPDFEKFGIRDKSNLTARILIPSLDMATAFVHSVYRAEGVFKETDGRSKLEWDNSSYAGSYHCTGDPAVVAASPRTGDPTRCPACAAMHSGPKVVSQPKRQYAMNVIQYMTKVNSHEVTGDSVTVKLWKHGDSKKLGPIATALNETERDIKQIDFLITANADKIQFNDWTINFSENVAYVKNPALKAAVVEAISNGLYTNEDLDAALGTSMNAEALGSVVKEAQSSAMVGRQMPEDRVFVAAEPTSAPAASSGPVDEMPVTEITAASLEDLL
jgi:hypothetical protein